MTREEDSFKHSRTMRTSFNTRKELNYFFFIMYILWGKCSKSYSPFLNTGSFLSSKLQSNSPLDVMSWNLPVNSSTPSKNITVSSKQSNILHCLNSALYTVSTGGRGNPHFLYWGMRYLNWKGERNQSTATDPRPDDPFPIIILL